MTAFLESINPLLARVRAKDIKTIDDNTIEAIVYNSDYTFKLYGDVVTYRRGELANHFLLSEVPRLKHICMPYIYLIEVGEANPNIYELKADDISMRLHLIMQGDVCLSQETTFYKGACAQISPNFIRAR
jgi:hypothetical protein